jgi:hypothetical protein
MQGAAILQQLDYLLPQCCNVRPHGKQGVRTVAIKAQAAALVTETVGGLTILILGRVSRQFCCTEI